MAWAEVLGASDIFLGVNAVDYSGYPDCRPEFVAAFESMANLATKTGVEGTTKLKIHTPLLQLSKAEIIRLGVSCGVDYGLTHSCYDPAEDGRPCGECDSCLLRAKGFAEAGVRDGLWDRYAL
jgi:7-cyano-7-deazaguanine synthase